MIGLIRDRDLRDGKPMLIVYKLNRNRDMGFIIKVDIGYCTVKPYIVDALGARYYREFRVKYGEIQRFIEGGDRDGLFRYLSDKLLEKRINRFNTHTFTVEFNPID